MLRSASPGVGDARGTIIRHGATVEHRWRTRLPANSDARALRRRPRLSGPDHRRATRDSSGHERTLPARERQRATDRGASADSADRASTMARIAIRRSRRLPGRTAANQATTCRSAAVLQRGGPGSRDHGRLALRKRRSCVSRAERETCVRDPCAADDAQPRSAKTMATNLTATTHGPGDKLSKSSPLAVMSGKSSDGMAIMTATITPNRQCCALSRSHRAHRTRERVGAVKPRASVSVRR